MLTGQEEQRDTCSIGLKTVVLEMPQAMAVTAVQQLTPKLVSGMAADVNMAPYQPAPLPMELGAQPAWVCLLSCLDRSLSLSARSS